MEWRVLIVDDEQLARRFLRSLLARAGETGEVRECANGLDARSELASFQPDILFLDVQMPGLSGLDVLAGLREQDAPATIFTTAHSEHALRAFDFEACDYLLKPFDEARFSKALQRAQARAAMLAKRRNLRFPVQSNRGDVELSAKDIFVISAEDNYISVQTERHAFLQRMSLCEAARLLAPTNFVRVHRRFLVNFDHLDEARPFDPSCRTLRLTNGQETPISRRLRSRVKDRVGDFCPCKDP
jgi:two-component system LytT family response regulator